jgi:hypothetical protein
LSKALVCSDKLLAQMASACPIVNVECVSLPDHLRAEECDFLVMKHAMRDKYTWAVASPRVRAHLLNAQLEEQITVQPVIPGDDTVVHPTDRLSSRCKSIPTLPSAINFSCRL